MARTPGKLALKNRTERFWTSIRVGLLVGIMGGLIVSISGLAFKIFIENVSISQLGEPLLIFFLVLFILIGVVFLSIHCQQKKQLKELEKKFKKS